MTGSWSRRARAVLTIVLVALALAAITAIDPLKQGLTGRYFFTVDAQKAPVHVSIDAPPSSHRFAAVWNPPVPPAFSATWDGALFVWRAGTYTFATVSDDASSLHIDGTLVVDNTGAHEPRQRTGSVFLARGMHAVFLDYNQQGGGYHLEWLWGREGEPLTRVPGLRLAARSVGAWRFIASAAIWLASSIANWVAIVSVATLVAVVLLRWAASLRARLTSHANWTTLRWILLGSLALNAAGIWWGLPANWPAAEPTPKLVAEGQALLFSNGWHGTYPPFHFYVLTLATQPLHFVQWMAWTHLTTEMYDGVALLIFRCVSLVFSLGIVAAVGWLGRRAFGARAGLLAAAAFALVAPFVY